MTADELIAHLAKDCDLSRDVVKDVLSSLSDALESELCAGRPLNIYGLGRIYIYPGAGSVHPNKIQWQIDPGVRERILSRLNAKPLEPNRRKRGRQVAA